TPTGRSATTMTLLASSLTLAQALSAALTGAVAESVSIPLALALPALAALLVLVFGVLNVTVERHDQRVAYRVTYTSKTASAGSGS
ncbi:MAG: transporter, partial [Microbacterium sp.]|nr:transporter [Microbacterium sp.]